MANSLRENLSPTVDCKLVYQTSKDVLPAKE